MKEAVIRPPNPHVTFTEGGNGPPCAETHPLLLHDLFLDREGGKRKVARNFCQSAYATASLNLLSRKLFADNFPLWPFHVCRFGPRKCLLHRKNTFSRVSYFG